MGEDANKYYIAVDGGGSKTEFCVRSSDGGQPLRFKYGSSNYKISGADVEKETLLEGVLYIFKELGIGARQVQGLVMGMSGVDSPGDHNHYMDIAELTGVDRERIYICNDSELAFYSRGVPPGLCMIAGTGSVATGIGSNQQKVRSGGWGSPISDEGSGGWIGIKVLRELLRYCDEYGEYREVFELIREHFGAPSFEALPKVLSQISMPQIASVAKIVMDEADKGDVYGRKIVNQAAQCITEVAYSVYRRLQFEKEAKVDIVMAGSLYRSPTFTSAFKQLLTQRVAVGNLHFCEVVSSPVEGGITLAHILFGKLGHAGLATIKALP